MSQLENRYKLSENDLDIIKCYTDKPLSENARKTLIILSEVFGGLHHLEGEQLELFDYQSDIYNQYLLKGSLATFDSQHLTLLVIMAHDMAVRIEINATVLDPNNEELDKKLLVKHLHQCNSEYGYNLTMQQFTENQTPYLRLLFHQRHRDGGFFERHPTLEDTTSGFRANNRKHH